MIIALPDIPPTVITLPEHRSLSFELPVPRLTFKGFVTMPPGTEVPGDPILKLDGLTIAVEWTADGVVMASALVDEDGYGESFDAAWQDFTTSLQDRYHSLAKREASLSPSDRGVLKELRSLIKTPA